MTEDTDQLIDSQASRAWPLYAAAFSTALSLNICWTSMPFVLSGIGFALAEQLRNLVTTTGSHRPADPCAGLG